MTRLSREATGRSYHADAAGQLQSKHKRENVCSEASQDSTSCRESSVQARLLRFEVDDRGTPIVDEAVCLGIPKSIHLIVNTPDQERLLAFAAPPQSRVWK
jgi:hypothetical protein